MREMKPLQLLVAVLGLAACLLALPLVLLADGPFAGWLLGTALWCANWGGQMLTGKLAVNASPTMAVGMSGISFISRAWLVAAVLFVVALKLDEAASLTAAGVFIAAFTLDLLGRTITFTIQNKARRGGLAE